MINTVVMEGRLTVDPVLKITLSGKEFCVFSIAQNRKRGDTEETDFFDVSVWDGAAKYVCDHFAKGDLICVAGCLRTRRYEGEDGVQRVATEIQARNVSTKPKTRSARSSADGAFEKVD